VHTGEQLDRLAFLVGWHLPRPRPLTTHQHPALKHGLAAFGWLRRYDTRRRYSYLG
jgi:hypothetical protein